MEHLKAIANLSKSLWADPQHAKRAQIETISALTLHNLDPELVLKKAAKALLKRSRTDSSKVNRHEMNHPLYRLSDEQRFIVSAMHHDNQQHWNYDALAWILDCSSDQVQSYLWSARSNLALYTDPKMPLFAYGPKKLGVNCPEYDSQAPWTQAFMDEQMDGQQKLFLQTHLTACSSCRKTLEHYRKLYYQVNEIIPTQQSADDEIIRIVKKTQEAMNPKPLTFLQTLKPFIKRWDIQVMIALLFIATLIHLL